MVMGAPLPPDLAPTVALAKSNGRGMADGRPTFALPLAMHCGDVAACFRALLDFPVLRRRLAALAGLDDLRPAQCDRLAVLAALHDAGKVTLRFQRRIRGDASAGGGHIAPLVALLGEDGLRDRRDRSRLVEVRQRVLSALCPPATAAWFTGPPGVPPWGHDAPDPLWTALTAVLCHHGALDLSVRFDPADWQALPGYDPLAALERLNAAVRGWFPGTADPDAPPIPMTGRLAHALAGLMVWADWLGSDTDHFPLLPIGALPAGQALRWDRLSMAHHASVVRKLLARRGLDPAPAAAVLSAQPWTFDALFPPFAGRAPRPMQKALLDLPPHQVAPGGVLVLEAETGSGKTEAAVLHFLSLLRAGMVEGMYFALPTRSSAVQIQRRLRDLLAAALGPGQATPPVGLAVPGYLRMDDADGYRLPDYRISWPDSGRDLDDRGWAVAHAARYMTGPVMVGTVDQLLLGGLPVRHAPLRSAAMLRQLLVVDEVHASDPYMSALLAHVLDQHRAAGGHALLMSATLGATARVRLTGGGKVPTLADAVAAPYPALHGASGIRPPVEAPTPREISVDLRSLEAEGAALAELVAAARTGARVLILRNTVAAACGTQRAVEDLVGCDSALLLRVGDERVAAPHHARFAAEDRVLLDLALEDALGRGRPGGGLIAVATQTAEQSLDLDADLMLTDLCPADVLLQRLGRLHRHARDDRPAGVTCPRAIVLSPGLDDLAGALGLQGQVLQRRGHGPLTPDGVSRGWGTVYPDLLGLAATRATLARHPRLTLPAMNRALVEATTHPEALEALAADLDGNAGAQPAPELWRAHRKAIAGIAIAQSRYAGLLALSWVDWRPEALLANVGEEISTRLGEKDRQVDLPPMTMGPFGHPISTLKIPAHLLRDTALDAPIIVEATTDRGISLQIGSARLFYSRLGLHRTQLSSS